jgi:hypothetical protein
MAKLGAVGGNRGMRASKCDRDRHPMWRRRDGAARFRPLGAWLSKTSICYRLAAAKAWPKPASQQVGASLASTACMLLSPQSCPATKLNACEAGLGCRRRPVPWLSSSFSICCLRDDKRAIDCARPWAPRARFARRSSAARAPSALFRPAVFAVSRPLLDSSVQARNQRWPHRR